MGLMKRRFSIRIAVMGDFMLFITLYVYIPTYVEAYHKKRSWMPRKKTLLFSKLFVYKVYIFFTPY